MTLEIRQATSEDAPEIAQVKQSVWPESQSDMTLIAAVLGEAGHIAHVALLGGVIAGFVSSFITWAQNGVPRWEIDLLAVHPDYRGHGIAAHLVSVSRTAGTVQGAKLTRALVQIDNIASQRTFARCGCSADSDVCGLYISSADLDRQVTPPSEAHLIPVSTFNYRGIWLEGVLSPDSFVAAQAFRTRYQWDAAGAVIPLRDTGGVRAAQEAGYALVGYYQWWRSNLEQG